MRLFDQLENCSLGFDIFYKSFACIIVVCIVHSHWQKETIDFAKWKPILRIELENCLKPINLSIILCTFSGWNKQKEYLSRLETRICT